LFRRAFQRTGFTNHLIVLNDGDAALRYLKGEGQYGDRTAFPLPVMLLLDLSMPGLGGLELLQWIRTQQELKHLPVIILTSSTFAPDLARAYQSGANSLMSKPGDPTEYSATLKQLLDFWLNTTRLPHPFTPPGQTPPAFSGSAVRPT
jgi:CheY-like chemotaxis protein